MTTGRLHRSVRVVDGPRQAEASAIVTWAPGTPIAMVEEAIKAGARDAVIHAREQIRAEGQEVARG